MVNDNLKHRPKKHVTAKRYSLEFKMEAMKLLQANGMNVTKTTRELGVGHATVNAWRKKFLPEVENAAEMRKIAEIAEKVDAVAARDNESILQGIYEAKKSILDRMKVIIPDESNLDRLTNALKTLCTIDGTMKGIEGGDAPNQSLTLIQSLTQNFNNSGYESKTPLTSVGDTEK